MNRTATTLLILAALMLAGCGSRSEVEKLPHFDTSLTFEARADSLVSRMTLEEKIAQMGYEAPAIERLGVPAYNWWNECLHGVGRAGLATVFPQAIGMAAMWNTPEMERIATTVSDEARAKHHAYARQGKRNIYQGLTYWTPNINIFRDPRWGRGMETYGEDPYLTGELGVAYIKGLQGDDPKYLKLVATPKHFVVHSGPESTRHSADVTPSTRDLLETYTPHFKKAVQEGGAWSVMCAYQRYDGLPCCGNPYLSSLLRDQWGFDGYIVSDCGAIRDFYAKGHHEVVPTKEAAAAMAVQAGTDLNCGDTYPALLAAVEQGLISEQEIDVSVRRLMLARLKLGMFDPDAQVPYARIPIETVDSPENRQLALDAARQSMVLLKNDGLLPLSKDIKKVAVIGPNADDLEVLLGNYNGYPSDPKTPLAGIREKLPQAEVKYAQGCPLAPLMPHLEAVPGEYLYTDATRSTPGLSASYFKNGKWEGSPAHQRTEANIDNIWWTAPPFPDMRYEDFSARWEGVLVPPVTGEYALGAEGYYGFRLYLNDSLLIRFNSEHHPRKEYERLTLEAGKPYKIKVEYCQKDTEYPIMRLLWDMPETGLQEEAVALARESDVAILCMGLSPLLEGEEMKVKVEGFAAGDRVDIKLPAVQTELIRAIYETGKPVVLVLLNGSAVAFNWEAAHLPAILEAWYPGQAGGTAIADVLFGDYNPAGRLPVTFYKSIDQIPAFENYDMQGKTYRYFKGDPLYPFGYGLSYTTFTYKVRSVPAAIKAGETLRVTVDVTNTGDRDGDEVIQLYTSLPGSKYRVPLRSLQGFRREHIKAGETRSVEFNLTPQQMAAYDNDNVAVVEAGDLVVSVGGGQPSPQALAAGSAVEQRVKITGNSYYPEM